MSRTRRKYNKKYKELDELMAENKKLEKENAELRKQLKKEPKQEKKPKIIENPCPNCGAKIKESILPFGKLKLCSAACGWRKTVKDKE